MAAISETLEAFDPNNVHAAWQKALDRRALDPEGAITAARTLVETVCKHILDDAGEKYPDDADLPKLWAMAAEQTNLAPHQHQEGVFKAILGNCQAVVNNLGAIRNRGGDAHGQGRRPVKPKPRHAELAVNLAGTMASFLVATWKERGKEGSPPPRTTGQRALLSGLKAQELQLVGLEYELSAQSFVGRLQRQESDFDLVLLLSTAFQTAAKPCFET